MPTLQDKLSESLAVLKKLQDKGVAAIQTNKDRSCERSEPRDEDHIIRKYLFRGAAQKEPSHDLWVSQDVEDRQPYSGFQQNQIISWC
jgi:hypothetical protein